MGDQILIAVASEITNLFGEDSTYRYGGDEFLIIQKDYTRSEISTLLMVWADAVRNIRLDIIPEEGDFSCSYGFTYGRPSGEEELRQMVVRADRKLYEMKRSPSRVSHSSGTDVIAEYISGLIPLTAVFTIDQVIRRIIIRLGSIGGVPGRTEFHA